MTMAANFAFLLRDFMNQLDIKITSITIPREPSNFACKFNETVLSYLIANAINESVCFCNVNKKTGERSMVVIEANGNQGTGTFVKVQNKKFIITCSHVVFQVIDLIRYIYFL